VTVLPSSKRRRFSSRTFIEKGEAGDVAELGGGFGEGVISVDFGADLELGAGA
jgi:hypothetical protein